LPTLRCNASLGSDNPASQHRTGWAGASHIEVKLESADAGAVLETATGIPAKY